MLMPGCLARPPGPTGRTSIRRSARPWLRAPARWRDAPARDDEQAVADLEQFLEFLADHQQGTARVAQGQQFGSDLRCCANVDTPGRLADDQHLGAGGDLAADDELLQVAARQAHRRGVGAAGLDLEARDQLVGHAPHLRVRNPAAAPRYGLGARQQRVLGQGERRYGPAAQSFIGYEVQAQPAARTRPGA
jgi:hypothetical protein